MSNSDLFQVEKDPKVMEFNILLRSTTLEFSSDGFLIVSSLSDDYQDHQLHHAQGPRLQPKQQVEDDDDDDEYELKQEEKKDREYEGGVSSSSREYEGGVSSSSSKDDDEDVIEMRGAAARTRTRTIGGELEAEDNEGFRTPTYLDHGIPVIQQCPPAPRKPKPSPKRKPTSSTTGTRTIGGELEAEDNEGFRTPTYLDHVIPVIQQCPPAPRKPKPSPKRKPSSSTLRQLFLLDLSQEIGSLFPPALLPDLGPKMKKVCGGDHDTN